MNVSTTILGPYDDMTSSEKVILSASVPKPVRRFLFEEFLPRRGAIDKVICRLLNTLDEFLNVNESLVGLSEDAREHVVNELLNSFAQKLTSIDAQTLIPTQNLSDHAPQESHVPGHVRELL